MIDLYCERTGSGLWGEPFNIISNLAFFIAAIAIMRLSRQKKVSSPQIALLIAFLFAIGFGSITFHMFATGWARLLDEIPIMLFQLIFLWVYLRRMYDMGRLHTVIVLSLFLALVLLTRFFPYILNRSIGYVPSLLCFGALGYFHFQKAQREKPIMIAAASVFFVSLVFRTLDSAICPCITLGTHFIWHIANGLALYLLMRALIVNSNQEEKGISDKNHVDRAGNQS